jgi:hypothetical protein
MLNLTNAAPLLYVWVTRELDTASPSKQAAGKPEEDGLTVLFCTLLAHTHNGTVK